MESRFERSHSRAKLGGALLPSPARGFTPSLNGARPRNSIEQVSIAIDPRETQ